MTATQFERDFFGQNQEATELPYWRIRIVTATATPLSADLEEKNQ
jgi:hypothetical protein